MTRTRFGTALALCMILPFSIARAGTGAEPVAESAPTAATQLGVPGQWFLAGSSNGLLQFLVGPSNTRGVNFNLDGSAGYFFSSWVFARLGLGVGTSYLKPGVLETQTTRFSLAPGVGFRVPLGGGHAFLPAFSYVFALTQSRAGFEESYQLASSSTASTSTSHSLDFQLFFSLALAPHLNLLLGPELTQTFTVSGPANAQSSRFSAGLAVGVLAYF